MRRPATVLLAVLVTAALAPVAHTQQPASAQRPNVVLIITDDMGYGDLSSYGARDIKTPNVDSLGRDGVRLTDFHSNGTLCTPTRAGLISGRYQQRYLLETALTVDGRPGSELGLPFRGHSLPHLLKGNGYATALVGKWHLGYKPEFSPRTHGFDYFWGLKSGLIDYYHHTTQDGRPDLWENDAPVQEEGYSTDLITAHAVKFIEANARQPFFIDVAYNAPHWPYQVPDMPSRARDNARHLQPHDVDTSTRAEYVAMVERMDRGVGEILRALERLQIANNTLVIFTNDNGGEWLSNNGPLYHRKHTVWEGGIRVPALMRWPGRIPRGQVSDQVGITMDLHATILAATNTAAPASVRFEGINLLPILEGKGPQVERTLFWRRADQQRNQRAVRSGDWKLIVDGGAIMLYNLRDDVSERNDLASRRQDVARRLRPLITAWEKDVDSEAKAGPPSTVTR
jgi:arylsulfatase A-like enzyme